MITTTQQLEINKNNSSSIAYKLKIHALSHYDIVIYPNLIQISFIAENYKDVNKKRIANKTCIVIRKNSNMAMKTISVIDNNIETIYYNSDSYVCNFDELFKILYPSIQNIYRNNRIIKSLKKQKRFNPKSDIKIMNRFNTEIKFHEDEKRASKRLLKNTLFNLF